jgi:hypothetical protein
MSDWKKIAEEALRKSKMGKQVNESKTLNESVLYPEGLTERMNPQLEVELRDRKHSLGKHPIFPETKDSLFEENVMGERFTEVVNRVKRAFECDSIDNNQIMGQMMPLVFESMMLEKDKRKELVELAIKMVREEYDMGEDVVEIHAELTDKINMEGTKKNPKPITVETEFNNHEAIVNANKEVEKRRFLNAMTQGAAKKSSHMFHMVDDELTNIEPRLANKYSKMMAAADYMYYVIPKMDDGISGGVVNVQFPTQDNPKAIIYAQAMVFPVLVHELVKGVMELLSAHGLPKDKKTGEFVINKADYLAAEPWDMRIGPGLWGRFTNAIEPDDFNLKHHIYSELAALSVDEFNVKMREIMANTTEGKSIVKEIANRVREELNEEEYNQAMNEISIYEKEDSDDDSNGDGFDFEELMRGGDTDESDDDSDENEGFDFGELF